MSSVDPNRLQGDRGGYRRDRPFSDILAGLPNGMCWPISVACRYCRPGRTASFMD